jgi:hypothetical protein
MKRSFVHRGMNWLLSALLLGLALYPAGPAQGLRSNQAGILSLPAAANGSILHVKPGGLPTADCLS